MTREPSAPPVTPERLRRIQAVLDRRQPDLTVLLDNVHKPHNFSAILRTCDAAGVLEAHAVWPDPRLRPNRHTSAGNAKWVDIRTHPDLAAAARHLHERGFRLYAAHPSPQARDFREPDWTRASAIVLGAELQGVSEEALRLVDEQVFIPMAGFGRSLNVSVAAAVLLFEAERQRRAAGLHARSRVEEATRRRMLFEWLHPRTAARCRAQRRPYPEIDERGAILAAAPARRRPPA